MQKKLIALAVASLVSGGAFAQSSVTIFGVVDLAIESSKYSDAAGNLTRMIPGGNTTNRIGFRGTEDLGNGLSANFLLEAQANPDNGTSAVGANVTSVAAGGSAASGASQFWNRSSTVGLAGKTWGRVNLGRQYTPWFNATAANDVFWVAGVGSSYILQAGDVRMNNSIRYDSANMNGFTAAVMYGLGQDGDSTGVEGTTATYKSLGKEVGLKLSYANGPIAINYGYDKQKTAVARAAVAVSALGEGAIGTAALAAVAADVNTTRNQLNASYNFGVVKLGLGWNTNKTSNSTQDDRVWTFTAIAPVFGKDSVKFGYTRLTNKLLADADARLVAVGYEHPMSKRTTLYGTYAKMNNDTLAAKTLLGGVGVAAGFDPSAWQFGVKHAF